MPKLIIIRGNSGSGKTSLSKELQKKIGSNTMVISQDTVRREMLNVKDGVNTEALPLLINLLEYGRKNSEVTILEGILYAEYYMPLFERATELYGSDIFAYYYDIPFEETLLRHNTKPNRCDFGEEDMRRWWNERDFVNTIPETVITADMSLSHTAEIIFDRVNNHEMEGKSTMEIEVRKLMPEDADAYANFFDTTPHDDHNPENTCYCVNWCSADHRAMKQPDREERRAMAIDYVQNGILQGYVALKDGKIIGWCNANTKSDCQNCAGLVFGLPDLQRAVSAQDEKVKAVYCFMVAEEYHRQGVARKLLQAVCEDAKKDGFDYVEAYPQKDASVTYMQFMGFDELYKSEGFERYLELEDKFVVRKYL